MNTTSCTKVTACRVSVGMPVYNAERYLEETLNSVLRQTYTDFQLFITDNASTDRTQAICREYAARDGRITYIRNPVNLGASNNYRLCFNPAASEYFRWQNADDPIEPTLIEECLKALDGNPSAVLAYGKTHIIDEHGLFVENYDDNLSLMEESARERFIKCLGSINLQHQMYGLIRRAPLARTALEGAYLGSDINLICELALYGKFIEIPSHLFNRRMHPQSFSADAANSEKQLSYLDPLKKRLVLQKWRGVYEHYKAVLRAPIPVLDKLALCFYLAKYMYWQKGPLMSELTVLVSLNR